MKAKQLFSILSRKELTNIATELANIKVYGMKLKANQFIEAIASISGVSPESLLRDQDKKCFTVEDLNAIFDHSSGTTKIAAFGFKMKVDGFWSDKITVCEGTFDENGFVRDPSINFTGSDNGISSDSGLSKQELNDNLQAAINHAFFIVNQFTANKEKIKSEIDLKNLIQGNWKISHIGKSSLPSF